METIKKAAKKVVKKVSATKPTGKFLNSLYEATSKGETENGAVTYTRSGSPLLDFYAQAGAMRKNPAKALELFQKAFAEDRQIAIRILFYLRDVRGGQGERELFRTGLEWLGTNYEDVFNKVIKHIPEYGRYDDMFFDNEKCIDFLAKQLAKDNVSKTPSLLAKWLPTMNASSATTRAKAQFMASKFGISEIGYRKTIRNIRARIKTVEEQMSANDWDKINYSGVPSQASRIYRKAFAKHDSERYGEFVGKAEKGEVKINASTLYPYQIYESVQNSYDKTLEALWNQLPDYTQGKNAIVVADTSGSMSGQPMSVCVSLALYFAERNKGQFQNHFISFSESPKLHRIHGATLREKMRSIELGDVANTNLQAVFDLILTTAIKNSISEDEMPSTIYIISDMEFDGCVRGITNHQMMKEKYEAAGYKIPTVVYWNVDARSGSNLPVQKDERGVTMVSGFSPVIFKMVVENKSPEEVMLATINSERYSPIVI